MIIGMVPMALGAGEGGEQNAPLGRAVIGGLIAGDDCHAVLRARGVQRDPRSAKEKRMSENKNVFGRILKTFAVLVSVVAARAWRISRHQHAYQGRGQREAGNAGHVRSDGIRGPSEARAR